MARESASRSSAPDGFPWSTALLSGVAVALPALALYLATLMPDVGFWDTAEFQAIGPLLGIAHPTGYPAYTLLAWLGSVVLQPLGNEALRANMLSALYGAGAAALAGSTVTLLTRRLVVGIGAGAGLAVTSYAWTTSLHADPHALHLFLAALLLLLLAVWSERTLRGEPADRWLVAAAVAFGVSLANHGLTFLLGPPIALFLLVVEPGILRRPRLVLACALALASTTVALYLYLPIRSAMDPPLDYANPENWEGFRYLVFAEQFRGEFQNAPDPFTALQVAGGQSLGELGLLALLGVVGAFGGTQRRAGLVLLLGGWFVVGWLFALAYVNADIGRYYLVPLMSLAVLGGLGAGGLCDFVEARLPATAVVRIALAAVVAIALLGPLPLAVATRYDALDQSDDRLARDWLQSVFAALPPNAVVISWWSYSTTLWYGLYVEHQRPDVTVIDDSTIVEQGLGDAPTVIDTYLGTRPVCLIRLPFDLPPIEQRYLLSLLPGVVGGEILCVEGRRALAADAHL